MILPFLQSARARRIAAANARADGIMAQRYDDLAAHIVNVARHEARLASHNIDGPATREAVRRLKRHASAFALMIGQPREDRS